MHTRSAPYRLIPLLFFWVLLTVIPGVAQVNDVLISERDDGTRHLPEADFVVADSANGLTAVVFGVTDRTAKDSLFAGAYVQLVDHGVTVGQPIRIADSTKHLSSRIRVAAVGQDFIIIYFVHGYPTSHAVYYQVLRTDSLILAPPRRLASSSEIETSPFKPEVIVAGEYNRTRLILWYDWFTSNGQSGLLAFRIDDQGEYVDSARKIAGYGTEIVRNPLLDGILLLANPEGPSRLLLLDDGRLDERQGPRTSGTYSLGADTSLTMLDGATFSYRARLFDSLVQTRTLPLSNWGVSPDQTLLAPDSARRWRPVLVLGRDGDGAQTPASLQVFGIRMDSTWTVRGLDLLDEYRMSDSSGPQFTVSSYRRWHSCSGEWMTTAEFKRKSDSTIRRIYVFRSPLGRIRIGVDPDTTESGCIGTGGFRPQARLDDSGGAIAVTLSDTMTNIDFPQFKVEIPSHHLPGISSGTGRLACTWQSDNRLGTNVYYSHWIAEIDTVRIGTRCPIGGFPSLPSPGVSVSEIYRRSWFRNIQWGGLSTIDFTAVVAGQARGYLSTHPPMEWSGNVAASTSSVWVCLDSGWTSIISESHFDPHFEYPPFVQTTAQLRSVSFNPDNSQFGISRARSDPPSDGYATTLFECRIGESAVEIDISTYPVNYVTNIIALASKHHVFIRIGDSIAHRLRGASIIDTLHFDVADLLLPRYTRILGPYFLRSSWSRNDSTLFRIQLYDSLGTVFHSAEIQRSGHDTDYAIVQSRTDSSFVVLFGGESGLHGAFLKKDLSVVVPDTVVSHTRGRVAHPAGLFRGDTLFAVWEDYRWNASRIYGTSFTSPLSGISSTPGGKEPTRDLELDLSMIPDPR